MKDKRLYAWPQIGRNSGQRCSSGHARADCEQDGRRRLQLTPQRDNLFIVVHHPVYMGCAGLKPNTRASNKAGNWPIAWL